MFLRLPCDGIEQIAPVSCAKYEKVDAEDVAKENEAIKAAMERMVKTLPWASKKKKEAREGGPSLGEDECPICGKRIRFAIAVNYNGHMHASCETEDCVNFME